MTPALISHAVDMAAYTNDVARRMLAILAAVDVRVFDALIVEIAKLAPSDFTMARLTSIMGSVRRLNFAAYGELRTALLADMELLSAYELEFNTRLVRSTVSAPASVLTVPPQRVVAAATETPIRGRLMSQWFDSLGERRAQRIQDTIARGYVEGRTTNEMVRELRGTRASNYTDGIMQIDRRDAEAVVRSTVGHFAQAAREELFAENRNIIKAVVWSSTLDDRTSTECMIRDGLRYTVDGRPIGHHVLWLGGPGRIHWGCRSSAWPETVLGERLGLGGGPSRRASMDGPVPGKLTYAQWIKDQSAERQDEILGPTRARMLRSGAGMDRFFNNRGRFLTLDELRKRDAELFS